MHHMQSAPHSSHSPHLFNQGAHAHAHAHAHVLGVGMDMDAEADYIRTRNPIASIHVKRQHGTMSSPDPETMHAHPPDKLQPANSTCPQRNEEYHRVEQAKFWY
ncbi:hypothetical protein COCC4DRAFT_26807 [Bipolaris maydis ATCC 48331]|uniref:Uncharacterized protein n=2 Tax=Cochliobolus heterostrophus TaxID=5016 RepID=M2TJ23_COCH5|nr:uncharacterized protein COCC4DRAFT_26807 [Bipolaris maydis ATCC 48331]EMD97410.1 hypothetical protein COCHEDRAFT_1025830 [Bipolaris maydis C5]ENI01450.1 hypothetical protein COCC4DRAFT_26807 [Bipolaris maydis ATCC 48331]